VSSDASATVLPLNAALQADADVIVSMSLLPKLMHIDYAAAAKKPACDLGQITSGNGAYELWGDDAGGRQRKGMPAKKGDPVALVLPVTDIPQTCSGLHVKRLRPIFANRRPKL